MNNPTMENASENLSQCINPKKSQMERYRDAQQEISEMVGELQ